MLKIVDIVTFLCIFVLIVILGSSLPNAIGGSIWLIVLMTFFYFVSHVLGIYQKEITLLNIILALIIGINYLNYFDVSGKYSKENIAISLCILTVLILLCVYLAILKPWTSSFELKRRDKVHAVLRLNLKAVVLKYELFSFPYLLFISIIFSTFHRHFSTTSKILRMIPVTLICLTIIFVLMKSALGKIKRAHLEMIFQNEEVKLPENLNLKTLLFGIIGVSFVFGSMIELARNQWLLWLTSFGATIAIILMIFQGYRHKISPDNEILPISINDVKILGTPQYWIKLAIVNFIGLLLVSITLIVLLPLLSG